ncbi:MAG: hypothetical protein RLZZ350_1953 [Verrucomicrobiota bacterium]|jgi:hypothetical protein
MSLTQKPNVAQVVELLRWCVPLEARLPQTRTLSVHNCIRINDNVL